MYNYVWTTEGIPTRSPRARNFHIQLHGIHAKYRMTNVTEYVTG